MSEAPLFDPEFLRAVEGLTLRARTAKKGGRLAEQRTRARGQGSDFIDFKPYVAGDELRTVDWNIYRRLGQVFVRVFEERQNLPVYLMVDASSSMFVERPPRIDAARRVALALAAIVLRQLDAVSVMPFGDAMSVEMQSASGRASLPRVASILSAIQPMGGTGLVDAIDKAAAMKLRRGMMIVLSDFFDPAGLEAVLGALKRVEHRVLLVQMTRDYDADPQLLAGLEGDVILDDGERDDRLAISITPAALAQYRAAYAVFSDRLTQFAQATGSGLLRVDAADPVIDQLTRFFRNGELVL